MSFADDTRLYHGISSVDDCTILQNDLILYMIGLLVIICLLMPKKSNIYVLVPILHYLVTYTQILVLNN